VLSLDGVTYRHAGAISDSLRDVTLELPDGSLSSLLGMSASGVSTLCLVLGGLAPRVVGGGLRGALRVDGRDATGWPMHRLVEHVVVGLGRPAAQLSTVARTVLEEVAFGPANLGLPQPDVMARGRTALQRLGVAELAERDPVTLSSGEQQRVVIAGLVAMGTRYLVLDGALAHVDPAARSRTLTVLRRLADDGAGVLLAGHRRADLGPDTDWDQRLGIAAGRLSGNAEPAAREVPHGPMLAAGTIEPPASAVPDIRLERVSHRYRSGVMALRGVDVSIPAGQAVAIVGTNGSGKTTLLRHLDGLLRPTSGRFLLAGADAAGLRVAQLACSVAVGFGEPDDQVFARSVRAEVAFGPRQLGRDDAALARAVEAALSAVGLGTLATAHPADLGASQRRLLALASLLAMACPVLVLDEPTAGLDDAGVSVVEAIIAAQSASGRTVVVASHDEAFVAGAFGRVLRMEAGRIVADGPPGRILQG
jgi:energy-coupling factor transporter ATP-binding protein EcfA2